MLLSWAFISCEEEVYTPKPRGYFRISLPPHDYTVFDPAECPFRFLLPKDATIDADDQPCWYLIQLPELNAQIYLTYKPINRDLNLYAEETRNLVYAHTTMASSIDEYIIEENGAAGILYEIGGNAASPLQFYLSENSKHFLRGALYFNTAPNADSIAPVLQHVKVDVMKMISSLEWKN